MGYLKWHISDFNDFTWYTGDDYLDKTIKPTILNLLSEQYSFATTDEEKKQIIEEYFQASYKMVLSESTLIIQMAKERMASKEKTIARTSEIEENMETVGGSYFEPFVNGTQAEVKTTNTKTTYSPESTTDTSIEKESLTNERYYIEATDEIKKLCENVFKTFINNWGCCE